MPANAVAPNTSKAGLAWLDGYDDLEKRQLLQELERLTRRLAEVEKEDEQQPRRSFGANPATAGTAR